MYWLLSYVHAIFPYPADLSSHKISIYLEGTNLGADRVSYA